MLVRLLYASRAVEAVGASLVDAILSRSREYNAEHGITGVLCVCPSGNVFIQVLEGAREEVNRLYNNIVRDPRHRDITLLDYAEIDERGFANWRMGRIDLNRVNVSTVLRYSEKAVLDPFTLSGKAAHALLRELSTTAAVVGRGEASK
jgi:hypothetical protein